MEVRTMGPENRTETGTFKAGHSGNPGGRPKKTALERKADELFRDKSLRAATALLARAADAEPPVKVRAEIYHSTLDRALGKPKASGEIDVRWTPADAVRALDARLKGSPS
jgi:hypothetical protein